MVRPEAYFFILRTRVAAGAALLVAVAGVVVLKKARRVGSKESCVWRIGALLLAAVCCNVCYSGALHHAKPYDMDWYYDCKWHPRPCFSRKMNGDEYMALMGLVRHIDGALTRANISWIPVSGGLLAVYRHRRALIPWDDDYDITVSEGRGPRAVQVLRASLPSAHGRLLYLGRNKQQGWGHVYKAFFERTHPRFGSHLRGYQPAEKYTWPNVDIFFNGTDGADGPMCVRELGADELPLRRVKLRGGMAIPVPSRGRRSHKAFRGRKELMEVLMERPWDHMHERSCDCVGETERPFSPQRSLRNLRAGRSGARKPDWNRSRPTPSLL